MMLSADVNHSRIIVLLAILLCAQLFTACAHVQTRYMQTTAYCGCTQCCSWGRGSWKYLKLDFWNRYYVAGPDSGKPYHGHTASGSKPREPNPGLISLNSITHPWMIPVRIVFPWLWIPYPGTIAADTNYYPFGTEMYVPGYGDGMVEDRGSAIKGEKRIDLYFNSHGKARQWSRQTVEVEIKE